MGATVCCEYADQGQKDAHENRQECDGIRVSGRAQMLDGVLATENGRDGFRISGRDNQVVGGANSNGHRDTARNGRNQVGVVTEVRP